MFKIAVLEPLSINCTFPSPSSAFLTSARMSNSNRQLIRRLVLNKRRKPVIAALIYARPNMGNVHTPSLNG